MVVLGLDTTGPRCSAALVSGAHILAHKSENIGRGHAERLAPIVAEIFTQAGITAQDIERIAVCTGPGSFTGLRVALAFAKGLALPRRIPVLGLSSLHIFARMMDPEGVKTQSVYTDVKRGEISVQHFINGTPTAPAMTQANDIIPERAVQFTGSISTPVLGWLAADLSASDYAATALYARAPDAKLPGGITPT